ncbi:hypothetical protein B5E84_02150 [Lachnoclostridium sp. An14]|uniref:hypothetical protein n=1 Tax=Lachnoclostridium sp. An14 TaxID=1965562 RepID=UPI000B381677|nr:hypothetical protein [Lachnoclostridium sp. An14]OUQ21548.1 hypothetical protein B5E84_02150 [Lachnoclostridium sp. An14]
MADKVIGSPEEARELSRDLKTQMQALCSEISMMESNLKSLGGSFQDAGYQDVEDTVKAVFKETMAAMEPVSEVCKSLNEYAAILDRYRNL